MFYFEVASRDIIQFGCLSMYFLSPSACRTPSKTVWKLDTFLCCVLPMASLDDLSNHWAPFHCVLGIILVSIFSGLEIMSSFFSLSFLSCHLLFKYIFQMSSLVTFRMSPIFGEFSLSLSWYPFFYQVDPISACIHMPYCFRVPKIIIFSMVWIGWALCRLWSKDVDALFTQ